MAVYKDKNGTWYVSARYTNWKGEADRKVKRGFQTKREAAEWEKNFFLENAGNLDMTFEAFYQLYKQNTKDRIKLNTWKMKESVIEGKILDKTLTLVVLKHERNAASHAKKLKLIQHFNIHSEEHRIPNAQQITMRYHDDTFIVTCHNLIKQGLQAVPFVSSALCIGEHTVINGFLLNLNVFTKPLNGFTNAFAQVTLTKLSSNDRRNS